jgi:hypothetical protein
MTFVVSGFTNAANNGTFVCVTNGTTTITLNNASGVNETHAATAAGPTGLNDTHYTFEAVTNRTWVGAINRSNVQGTTQVTSVAPAPGVWHRLDMVCTEAGKITCTLDGSKTDTITFTINPVAYSYSGSSQAQATNGIGRVGPTTSGYGLTLTSSIPEVGEGSTITVSALTGGNAALNGNWILDNIWGGSGPSLIFPAAVGTITNNSTAFTLSAYPALTPFVSFGNDDSASPTSDNMRLYVDFFSLVWNPNLVKGNTATADPTLPRYF